MGGGKALISRGSIVQMTIRRLRQGRCRDPEQQRADLLQDHGADMQTTSILPTVLALIIGYRWPGYWLLNACKGLDAYQKPFEATR